MLFSQKIILSFQLLLFILLNCTSVSLFAAKKDDRKELFKPFILAEQTNSSMEKAKAKVEKLIENSPFSKVAEYTPYDSAHIFIISSDELKSLASKARYGGFAVAQRISLTKVKNKIQIAYTNPVYMQHAFRMKKVDLRLILVQMKQAFGFQDFFGGDGLTARQLKRYNYSMGLEDFDSFYELPEYKTHEEAVAALMKGFNKKDTGISKVYQIKLPNKDQVVFGIAMSETDSGEESLNTKTTMDIVDYQALKRTAYLPYEIMVDDNRIIALHARFRIAAFFYDIKMFGKHGFGKLFSIPHAYLEAFTKVSGGSLQQGTSDLDFLND